MIQGQRIQFRFIVDIEVVHDRRGFGLRTLLFEQSMAAPGYFDGRGITCALAV